MLHNKARGVGALFHSKRVLDIIVAPTPSVAYTRGGGGRYVPTTYTTQSLPGYCLRTPGP